MGVSGSHGVFGPVVDGVAGVVCPFRFSEWQLDLQLAAGIEKLEWWVLSVEAEPLVAVWSLEGEVDHFALAEEAEPRMGLRRWEGDDTDFPPALAARIADRLETLPPRLDQPAREMAVTFAAGLRSAAGAGETVQFW